MQPHIVQFVDCDIDHTFVIMEFVEGGTIHQEHTRLRFSPHEVETILHGTLDALQYLHSFTIIHHDVKPDNILVHSRADDKVHIKLADFGISQEQSLLNAPGGSPHYSAPEVFLKNGTWKKTIDVWAVGVIALEYLFKLPSSPQPDSRPYPFYPDSPYANGWNGRIRKALEVFLKANRGELTVPKAMGHLIDDMLKHDPDERPDASEALGQIRKIHKPSYFKVPDPASIRVGSKRQRDDGDIQPRKRDMTIKETKTDKAPFKFVDLEVGEIGLVSTLHPCCVVSLDTVLKCAGKDRTERENIKKAVLEDVDFRAWRIKRPGSVRTF